MFGLQGLAAKIVMYLIGALVVAGIATGAYFGWRHVVAQKVLNEYNAKQIDQARQDLEKYQADTKAILDNLTKTQEEISQKNKALQSKIDNIKVYVNSPAVKKEGDSPAPEIIQETIRRLGK